MSGENKVIIFIVLCSTVYGAYALYDHQKTTEQKLTEHTSCVSAVYEKCLTNKPKIDFDCAKEGREACELE